MANTINLNPDDKVHCFEVTMPDGTYLADDLTFLLEEESVGSEFRVKIVEKTRAELDAFEE